MMPDSVIADAASQPEDTLDLSQMLGAPRTPNPAQVAQAKGNAWKEFAPILAMLPIVAAKGGRVGVAAMLSGLERSQREREAQQMRAEQMGMQRQQFDATQQARQQAIQASADQQRQRMAQELLRDLASGLQGAEDEQQAQQFIDAMLPAIQQAGIPMGRIEAMRMQLAAPSRMTQKRAKKALDAVLTTTAKEDLGSVRVNFDGQALGVDELAALATGAGGMQVTRAPKPAPEPKAPTPPSVGSFEDYLVRLYGNNPTPDQIRRARKDYMQADDRPPQMIPIVVQGPNGPVIVDRGAGVATPVRDASGAPLGPAVSGAERTTMAEGEASIDMMNRIEQSFRPEYVGPLAGRLTQGQMAVPGLPDVEPAVASFHAEVAALRNEIIRLMSGAAVSGAEEQRMRAQIPDVTQKPNVFKANLAATKRNRETLLRKMSQRTGQSTGAATPTVSAQDPLGLR